MKVLFEDIITGKGMDEFLLLYIFLNKYNTGNNSLSSHRVILSPGDFSSLLRTFALTFNG